MISDEKLYKKQETLRKLIDMDIGEYCNHTDGITPGKIVRVPNGWIYIFYFEEGVITSNFVPESI